MEEASARDRRVARKRGYGRIPASIPDVKWEYSAEHSSFGRRTAGDLPVDSHMAIALCAPRLTFISHGIPEKGDAQWLDHQGSFMAAIAAQPVFRLLGARISGAATTT